MNYFRVPRKVLMSLHFRYPEFCGYVLNQLINAYYDYREP